MSEIVKTIGMNIKHLREKNGYSRNQLAQLSGTHLAWISKIEAGQRTNGKQIAPSIIVLNKIANALHVKVEELLKDCNNKPETLSDNEILSEIKTLLKKQNGSNKAMFLYVARKILK